MIRSSFSLFSPAGELVRAIGVARAGRVIICSEWAATTRVANHDQLERVHRRHDPVSTTNVLDGLRALRPAGPVIELPGLGHYPQIEDPSAYAAGALRLLTQ
jgi:pimeloyl-ACP methyl ester carboxylesterase